MALVSAILLLSAPAVAEVPAMPTVTPVPPSLQPPLSSATWPGTEYSDLGKAGYVEAEYYLSGVGPAITASGIALFDVPYISRILVRRPVDPARFNGTVIIEPFSWFGERGAGWILTRDYLLRKGYAYVGYTLSINAPKEDPKFPDSIGKQGAHDPNRLYTPIVNLDFMRRFDFVRYAPLGSFYDPARFARGGTPDPFVPQSQAIGAQLARMLKTNDPPGPLPGLRVERVYVNSWAVTAQVWMDYLDQGRHQSWRMPDGRPLIDAYMTGKMAFGEVGGDVLRTPRKLPDNVPFVTVYSQSEAMHDALEGIALPADSDRPMLRYYEVTGMPHLREADLGTQHRELVAADVGKANDIRCRTLYDEPSEAVASALLDGMDAWVRTGKPMPIAPRLVRKGKGIARDRISGNMIGGIRPPWVVVPSATYLTDQETHCGLVYDTKVPLSRAQLRRIYGSFSNYVRRFETAKRAVITQRFLLAEDADKVQPIARSSDF